jgi:hypothetical protein
MHNWILCALSFRNIAVYRRLLEKKNKRLVKYRNKSSGIRAPRGMGPDGIVQSHAEPRNVHPHAPGRLPAGWVRFQLFHTRISSVMRHLFHFRCV